MTKITDPTDVAEQVRILHAAAKLLRTNGITHGKMRAPQDWNDYEARRRIDPENCRHCTMGAVLDIMDPQIVRALAVIDDATYSVQDSPILQAVAAQIMAEGRAACMPIPFPGSSRHDIYYTISRWNDGMEDGVTAEEAAALLERTADTLSEV